jgi:hypothetical protein
LVSGDNKTEDFRNSIDEGGSDIFIQYEIFNQNILYLNYAIIFEE